MLTLSVIPCNDQQDCDLSLVSQSVGKTTDHSDHDGDTEHCPPFCQCACCGLSSFFETSAMPLALWPAPVVENISIYTPPGLYEVHLNIWQPPKLS
jgi:hypothetical protein